MTRIPEIYTIYPREFRKGKRMAERKKAFKDMTFREKVEQIWEYYKPVLLAIVLGVWLIIYIIYKILNPPPEVLLNVALVNGLAYESKEDDAFTRFLEEKGYNTEEVTIAVGGGLYLDAQGMSQASMASLQALVARNMAGDIDILVGDEYTLSVLGSGGGLKEMDEILSAEQMEKYADRLYTAEDTETGEKYVCGLKLPESNLLTADGYYGEEVWAGIPYTAKNSQLAKEVFQYLLGE